MGADTGERETAEAEPDPAPARRPTVGDGARGTRARVLGPLALENERGPLRLPSDGRVRALLEHLLLRPNETHSVTALSEHLWPGQTVDVGVAAGRLQTTVSRLRRLLDPQHQVAAATSLTVVTDRGGYRLHATPDTLDRLAFEAAAAAALDGSGRGQPAQALALWQGEPYTGFTMRREVQTQRRRLDALRRRLLEARRVLPGADLERQLLRAKLQQPRSEGPGIVTRRRLLAATPDASGVDVLAVSAPAGYGKSTFVAQWVRSQGIPVAWVNLDEDDDDPSRFWSSVVHALAAAGIPIPGGVPRDERGSDLPPARLPSVIASVIGEVDSPLVLVLDDLHRLGHPTLIAQLDGFVAALPASATLAYTSRRALPPRLGRFAVAGRARVVTAAELRFDLAEVAELLEASGTCTTDDDIRQVHERSEGWPVAVRLSRPAEDHPADQVPTALARYIVDEVVADLPTDVATFVLGTAHLDRFSRPLCDAVMKRRDAGEILAWLRRHEWFVVEDAIEPGWYRYHGLIAAELRRHARTGGAVDRQALDRRAARWLSTHGRGRDALDHAVRGRDRETVAAIAGDLLVAAAQRGEFLVARSWLERLDHEDLAHVPGTHAVAVVLAAVLADQSTRLRWVRSHRRAGGAVEDVVATFARALDSLREGRSTEAVASLDRVLRDARSSVDVLGPDLSGLLVSSALSNQVLARLLQDTLRHDDELFARAVTLSRPTAPQIAGWIHSYWALAAYIDGDVEMAASLAAEFHAGRRALDAWADATFESSVIGALIVSSRTADPATHRRLAAGLEPEVRWMEAQGWATQVAVARLVAACLYRRAGASVEAAVHAGRADVLLRTFEDAPFLHRLREHLSGATRTPSAPTPVPGVLDTLTDRERTVLGLLATDRSLGQIATALHISPHTVRSHTAAIYRKLGVHSRHEAILAVRAFDDL